MHSSHINMMAIPEGMVVGNLYDNLMVHSI
jgi:hypothetical protein